MSAEHHERLVRHIDELVNHLDSLPTPQLQNLKPVLRKDWLTTPAEFLLLESLVEDIGEHARRIGELNNAFIGGIREIAREAGVSTAEIEAIGRAPAAASAR